VRPVRSSAERITEVKRHLEGGEHRFECDLLIRRPGVVVVRYRHWEGRSFGPFPIARGSVTHGFFWPRRSYSLYRMSGPGGRPIADRYDVVEDLRVSASEISYLDLLLDIWVAPDGTLTVEDEDEVRDCARRGLLSPGQVARIERTRDLIGHGHGRIAREAARLLAG
jgi:hypothetical protein